MEGRMVVVAWNKVFYDAEVTPIKDAGPFIHPSEVTMLEDRTEIKVTMGQWV
jgi:hypothetical protein